jgi:DNA-binding transcriptional ArsR family regulator
MIGHVPKELQGNLSEEDFSEPYRLIARSLFATASRTGSCDVVSVSEEMGKNGAGALLVREIGVLAGSAPVGEPNLAQLIRLIKERNGQPGSQIAWEVFDATDYKQWKVKPLQWAVEPIIPKDTIGYVGGLPKIGKSLVMCDLLLHIIHKQSWLGRYKGDWVPRSLYLAREDPPGRLKSRIDEMQEGYSFPPIPRGMLRLLVRERFQLTDDSHIKWLTSFCSGEGIDFLILDVLGRMIRGKDQMDPADWSDIQDILERLNREHGLTIAMLDHTRKPAVGTAKRTILSPVEIKGPIEKYGGADWSLIIGRTKERGRLEIITEGKDTDERLHFLVDMAPQARRETERWLIRQADGTWQPGKPGPKLTYAGDVTELAENQKEVGRKNRQAVYAVFGVGEKLQIGTVLEHLKRTGTQMARSTAGNHLKALVEEEGKLDTTGDGRNAWYWRREETSD